MSSKAWIMDWEQLAYFRTAGRLQHITQAAERLGITQPTLSRSLARLERELGVPLFAHAGRAVVLTPYGIAFLERVERALGEIDEGRREIADLAGSARGRIRLGFLRSLGSEYVPDVVRRFRDKHADVEFDLVQNNGATLEAQLRSGELDCALLAGPLADKRFAWKHVLDQELVVVVPRGHRLAARRAITLATIRDEPLLSFKPGHAIRAVTDQLCADAGFAPNVVFAGDESSVIRGFVKAGFGIALVPQSTVRDGLVTVHVRAPKPIRRIGVAWLRDRYRTGAERAFERWVCDRGSANRTA
jgi:DNA-binding transcriptional LysR family regulator